MCSSQPILRKQHPAAFLLLGESMFISIRAFSIRKESLLPCLGSAILFCLTLCGTIVHPLDRHGLALGRHATLLCLAWHPGSLAITACDSPINQGVFKVSTSSAIHLFALLPPLFTACVHCSPHLVSTKEPARWKTSRGPELTCSGLCCKSTQPDSACTLRC